MPRLIYLSSHAALAASAVTPRHCTFMFTVIQAFTVCMPVLHAGPAFWVQGQWHPTGQVTTLLHGQTSGDQSYLTSLQRVADSVASMCSELCRQSSICHPAYEALQLPFCCICHLGFMQGGCIAWAYLKLLHTELPELPMSCNFCLLSFCVIPPYMILQVEHPQHSGHGVGRPPLCRSAALLPSEGCSCMLCIMRSQPRRLLCAALLPALESLQATAQFPTALVGQHIIAWLNGMHLKPFLAPDSTGLVRQQALMCYNWTLAAACHSLCSCNRHCAGQMTLPGPTWFGWLAGPEGLL